MAFPPAPQRAVHPPLLLESGYFPHKNLVQESTTRPPYRERRRTRRLSRASIGGTAPSIPRDEHARGNSEPSGVSPEGGKERLQNSYPPRGTMPPQGAGPSRENDLWGARTEMTSQVPPARGNPRRPLLFMEKAGGPPRIRADCLCWTIYPHGGTTAGGTLRQGFDRLNHGSRGFPALRRPTADGKSTWGTNPFGEGRSPVFRLSLRTPNAGEGRMGWLKSRRLTRRIAEPPPNPWGSSPRELEQEYGCGGEKHRRKSRRTTPRGEFFSEWTGIPSGVW